MHRRTSPSLLLASFVTVAVAACAPTRVTPSDDTQRPSASAEPKSCERVDQDSSSVAHIPLYRACAVDVKARPTAHGRRLDFNPPRHDGGCYAVVIQLAVDTLGAPELGSARVVRTNSATFARAALATVPELQFTPARIGGAAVRQLYDFSVAMTTQVGGPAQRPAPGSGPPCGLVGGIRGGALVEIG